MIVNSLDTEAERIKRAYAKRDLSQKQKLYNWRQRDATYVSYRQKSAWTNALMKAGFRDLGDLDILDLGYRLNR